MRKILLFLMVAFMAVACSAPTAENVLTQHSEALKKGEFKTSLWNLEAFAKIYYVSYWDNAQKEEQDKLVSLIERFSNHTALMQKHIAAASEIKEMEVLEQDEKTQKIKVTYGTKNNPETSLAITYLLQLENDNWKIINYEQLAYSEENVIDPVKSFHENFPQLMKDAGYEEDNISLTTINEFLEEKILKPAEEALKAKK